MSDLPSDLLRVDGLGRRYGDLAALDGVDLRVAPGDRLGLIGPNGAGKSTLLNLIAGSLRPTAGRIRFDGRDVTRLGPARRARLGVGRTHQHPAVWSSLPALDNVLVAGRRPWGRLRAGGRERARELLAEVGLAGVERTAAGALSHGQRRQLELAMALAGEPRLLLLDEPAAGLAPPEVELLASLLAALPRTVAILLVEHHLDLVYGFADRITVLHSGRHVHTGTVPETRSSPEVAAAYAGVAP
ncbi:ABC transporter ATP-binding protein [Dactylosporangium aurantiacum]|uniref:ABC transporter ATP-binding protein n=1 Tax=Dactylosporangium aurantiacum TaxID=35754 RepID=A0A9Q9ML58_9ACTN|nr:ABC transporter ATP-binding protein [Dactylosporangium aurantiacum]MDG6108979.1 ABC transporter ATP-binding protein [Dactylosporangium aurantiacum]UWZ56516.1 ABC transporter ATP-binding protein [Dactylosporangium aurantiacum]